MIGMREVGICGEASEGEGPPGGWVGGIIIRDISFEKHMVSSLLMFLQGLNTRLCKQIIISLVFFHGRG